LKSGGESGALASNDPDSSYRLFVRVLQVVVYILSGSKDHICRDAGVVKQPGYLHHSSPVQYMETSGRRGPVRPAIEGPLRISRVEFDEVVTSLQIDPHIVTLVDDCHVGVQVWPRRRVEGGLERVGVDSYQPLTQIIGCPDVVAVAVGTQTAWKDLSDSERCVPGEIIR